MNGRVAYLALAFAGVAALAPAAGASTPEFLTPGLAWGVGATTDAIATGETGCPATTACA